MKTFIMFIIIIIVEYELNIRFIWKIYIQQQEQDNNTKHLVKFKLIENALNGRTNKSQTKFTKQRKYFDIFFIYIYIYIRVLFTYNSILTYLLPSQR